MHVPELADVRRGQPVLFQGSYRDPMLRSILYPRMDDLRSQMGAIWHWRKSHGMTDVRRPWSTEVHVRHRQVQRRRSCEHRGVWFSNGIRVQHFPHAVLEQRQRDHRSSKMVLEPASFADVSGPIGSTLQIGELSRESDKARSPVSEPTVEEPREVRKRRIGGRSDTGTHRMCATLSVSVRHPLAKLIQTDCSKSVVVQQTVYPLDTVEFLVGFDVRPKRVTSFEGSAQRMPTADLALDISKMCLMPIVPLPRPVHTRLVFRLAGCSNALLQAQVRPLSCRYLVGRRGCHEARQRGIGEVHPRVRSSIPTRTIDFTSGRVSSARTSEHVWNLGHDHVAGRRQSPALAAAETIQ